MVKVWHFAGRGAGDQGNESEFQAGASQAVRRGFFLGRRLAVKYDGRRLMRIHIVWVRYEREP